MSLKIVFMGTPEFSVPTLDALIKNKFNIVKVYTQPPKKSKRGQKINKSSIQKLSENLSLHIRTPLQLKNNEEELKYFKSINPEIVVVVAYGQLIPKEFFSLSKFGFINVHPSLLPKWRGAAPIQRAIMNLDSVTGISVMKLEEKLDAGPVMFKKEVKLFDHINFEELSNKLSTLSSQIILDCLNLIEIGKAKFTPQQNIEATYAKKIEKNETKIDWHQNAKNIIGKINALSSVPGAWFNFNGERYKILKADLTDQEGIPGLILDDNLTIGCKLKSIRVIKIQRQGKNIQGVKDFLLGSKIKKGSTLS